MWSTRRGPEWPTCRGAIWFTRGGARRVDGSAVHVFNVRVPVTMPLLERVDGEPASPAASTLLFPGIP